LQLKTFEGAAKLGGVALLRRTGASDDFIPQVSLEGHVRPSVTLNSDLRSAFLSGFRSPLIRIKNVICVCLKEHGSVVDSDTALRVPRLSPGPRSRGGARLSLGLHSILRVPFRPFWPRRTDKTESWRSISCYTALALPSGRLSDVDQTAKN
jgi:hypothetical protein